MEFVEVKKYRLRWNVREHSGSISLYWHAPSDPEDQLTGEKFEVTDKLEFMLLVDVLRNEKPVFYFKETGILTTQKEDVGEGEVTR
ncbi:MAG: hypothetical protein Kow0069_17800 [Promethearchaeota archaeon]